MSKKITLPMVTDLETSLGDINCAQSVLTLFLDSMNSEAYTEDDRNMVFSAIKLIDPAINKLTSLVRAL